MLHSRQAFRDHRRTWLATVAAILLLATPARAITRDAPPDYFLTCDPDSFAYIYEHWWTDHEVPCTLAIDGVTWPDCRIRIRGDTSREYPKKSLKIKTDGEVFPSGSDVLNLNAEWLDRSYLRVVMATMLFERAGVPCFDASHARLHLNGEFFGLYVAIQNMDEDFLVANGLNPGGNLYKATNEDGDWSDLEQLVVDLRQVSDADFATWAAGGGLDWPEVVSLVACNALLSNGSTYYHNYYMFNDPGGGGGWQIFPWDVDKTFAYYGPSYNYDRASSSVLPDNPLPEHVFTSPEGHALLRDRVDQLVTEVFNLDFYDPVIDSLKTSIEASVLADETDDISSLPTWTLAVNSERLAGIYNRAIFLQDQLHHAPRVFRLARLEDALQDTVRFTWSRSIDPDGDDLTYTLKYGPDVRMLDAATVTVDGLVDTFYTLVTDLPDSTYFWQVSVVDGDEAHRRQATDSYSPFVIDRGSHLQPQISGDVALDAEGSPWFVDRDVDVLAGATLTLEPGAELRLAAGTSIRVHGGLVAAGTAEQPIRLRRAAPDAAWGGLGFDVCDGDARLSHVIVEGASQLAPDAPWVAVVCARFSPLQLDHVRFTDCQRAMYVHDGSLDAQACEFPENNGVEMLKVQSGHLTLVDCAFTVPPGDGDAVDVDALSSGEIRGCTFVDAHHGYDLIDIGSHSMSLLLSDNVLVGALDKAVSVGDGSQVTLVGNVILDCAIGVAAKDGSSAELRRNTFFGNGTALLAAEDAAGAGGGQLDIASTILAASQTQALDVDAASTAVVRYSLADTEVLPGVGNLQADPRAT